MLFKSALFIAAAGLAAASLSSNCTSAIIAVATSPETTCLDFTLLAPLLTSNTTSVIPTVNSWLGGMCSQSACSNATLDAVTVNITNGCSSDFASYGITATNNATAVVEAAYPTTREIFCLSDTAASSFCVTEMLNDVQTSTSTTLSIDNIVNIVTQVMAGKNFNWPQNVTCSNCSKAAYTILSEKYPGFESDNLSTIQAECGSSFTNGQIPSTIQQTASNSTSSSTSTSTGGAVSLSVSNLNVGLLMLVAVSSTFAIFI